MFVLDQNPTFTHPVTVKVPVDGGHEAQTFKVTFTVVDDDVLAKFDLNQKDSTTEFLQTVVTGFGDVQDGNGQAIDYSDKARDALIRLPYTRVPITRAYFDAVYKAQMGN